MAGLLLAACGLWWAAGTGEWRELLLAAAPVAILLSVLARSHGRVEGPARVLRWAILVYALGVLVLAGLDAARQADLPRLVSPLVVNPIEGREALKGWLVFGGHSIYPPPGGYPRLITLYPPLYYFVAAACTLFVGPGLACGKLAAALGLWLLVVALFGLGRRQGGGVAFGLAAALGFFILPEAENGFLCKPDTWAFGLLLAAVWAFPADRAAAGNRFRLLLAGILLAGAGLAKQQTWPLVAVFALFAFFWLPRRRDFGWFLLGLAGAGLALGGVFYALFGSGLIEQTVLFPRHMTTLAADNSLPVALSRLRQYAAGHLPLLCAYGAWLVLSFFRRRVVLADILLLASLPFLARTLMWSGSDTNHFLFASSVAVLGVASLAGRCLAGSPASLLIGALALAALVPTRLTPVLPGQADFFPAPADAAMVRQVRAILAGVSGPVLMDAEGAYLFAGTPDFSRLRLYDAFETDMYDRLGLAPILDSVMADDIRNRRVSRFVDSQVFISQDLLSLLHIYYEPAERVGRYAFYKPRPERGIVAMPVADRVTRRDGDVAAGVVEAENIRNWGRYIQAEDAAKPLVLIYEAVADAPVARAFVSFCPRLTGPGQNVAVAATDESGRELASARYGFGDLAPSGEGFANRSRLDFAPDGARFRIRLTATAGAQLWLDPAHPLVIGAE